LRTCAARNSGGRDNRTLPGLAAATHGGEIEDTRFPPFPLCAHRRVTVGSWALLRSCLGVWLRFLVSLPMQPTEEQLTALGNYRDIISQHLPEIAEGMGGSATDAQWMDGRQGRADQRRSAENLGFLERQGRARAAGLTGDVFHADAAYESRCSMDRRNPRCASVLIKMPFPRPFPREVSPCT
jgi:hypothetical protein